MESHRLIPGKNFSPYDAFLFAGMGVGPLLAVKGVTV